MKLLLGATLERDALHHSMRANELAQHTHTHTNGTISQTSAHWQNCDIKCYQVAVRRAFDFVPEQRPVRMATRRGTATLHDGPVY